MTDSPSPRPDLEQLRRRAKELRTAAQRGDSPALERLARVGYADNPTLAGAQLAIAREEGYQSWPGLKAAIEGRRSGIDVVPEFLEACVGKGAQRAVQILSDHPGLAEVSVHAAAAAGEADAVRSHLARDPASASEPDPDRGWPPVMFACYSQLARIDGSRGGLTAVVESLLDAGVDPRTHNGQLPNRGYQSALHGAVTTNQPDTVRLLLQRGAIYDDRVSLRASVDWADHECLLLLLGAGASLERTWAIEAAAYNKDAEGVRLLLDAARRNAGHDQAALWATQALGDIVEVGEPAVVATLLAFEADPGGLDPGADGPPLTRAIRAGRTEVADLLMAHGAADIATEVDRFIGACTRGNRAEVERLVEQHPGLLGRLTDADRSSIVGAADQAGPNAVELMLDFGFSAHARNDLGETALHSAAYAGRAGTVRLLLERGAEIDAKDDRFDGTPLGFATVGSGEQSGDDGDWVTTVRLLLDAGASRDGVWLTGRKAPSEEVAGFLRDYGVTPEQEDDIALDEPEDLEPEDLQPDDPEWGALAERVRQAYDSADLELFASLLDPAVRWGGGSGGCANREQVVAFFRDLLSRGASGRVSHIEARGQGLVVGLTFSRPSVGGVVTPGENHSYQLLRIRDGLIIEISGHETRDLARKAARRRG